MLYILVVFNKRNTARVAACWFIIYYRLLMHGNSNIKKIRLTSYGILFCNATCDGCYKISY